MARTSGVDRFAVAAAALGIEVAITRYPEGTRTAVDAATAIGCDVAQIVKSLVFSSGTGPVVALVSGANRVDLDKLAAAIGAPVRQATADEVRESTGYAIGGTPPFGHDQPLPTVVDADLLEHAEVWAAAGTPDAVFPLTPDRLVEASGATVVELAP